MIACVLALPSPHGSNFGCKTVRINFTDCKRSTFAFIYYWRHVLYFPSPFREFQERRSTTRLRRKIILDLLVFRNDFYLGMSQHASGEAWACFGWGFMSIISFYLFEFFCFDDIFPQISGVNPLCLQMSLRFLPSWFYYWLYSWKDLDFAFHFRLVAPIIYWVGHFGFVIGFLFIQVAQTSSVPFN